MSSRVGVVLFPGLELRARRPSRPSPSSVRDAEILWHGDRTVNGVDAVVVPGGFAHGDYLRPGAIARFSPVMGGGGRSRFGRRPGGRHLQRLPGADRGGPAPRGPAEEPRPEVHSVRRSEFGWNRATRYSRSRGSGRAGVAAPDQPFRGELHLLGRNARRIACGPRNGSCCVTPDNPERIDGRHRRRVLGRAQCRRADAPSRAGIQPSSLGSTDGIPLLSSRSWKSAVS